MFVEIVKFKHFAEGLSTVLLFKLLSIIYNRFDDLVDKAQVAACSVLVQMCQPRCWPGEPSQWRVRAKQRLSLQAGLAQCPPALIKHLPLDPLRLRILPLVRE